MKKILLTLTLGFVSALNTLSAQNETIETKTNDFNHWSLELSGGLTYPKGNLNLGYYTNLPSPYVVDFGVRYMINNKFGLKADFGYNHFENDDSSFDFETSYYRVGLQGVANLGRIMNFETWTNTIGLLVHAGAGVAQLEDENSARKDRQLNGIVGFTGQIRLSNRFALTGDVTGIVTAHNGLTVNGLYGNGGAIGVILNGTAGLTYYLGKNTKHADWIVMNEDKYEARFMAIESKMLDSDNDGVADYLDEEPNSAPGAMVNTKGKTIVVKDVVIPSNPTESDLRTLINGGYVGVYYDFNKSTPTPDSTGSIDFILTYLRNNPSANIEITGYADEIGSDSYNDTLSNARANNVKETLVNANVDPSRLTVVGAGEDTSVSKDSDAARSLVRKVTFKIK